MTTNSLVQCLIDVNATRLLVRDATSRCATSRTVGTKLLFEFRALDLRLIHFAFDIPQLHAKLIAVVVRRNELSLEDLVLDFALLQVLGEASEVALAAVHF